MTVRALVRDAPLHANVAAVKMDKESPTVLPSDVGICSEVEPILIFKPKAKIWLADECGSDSVPLLSLLPPSISPSSLLSHFTFLMFKSILTNEQMLMLVSPLTPFYHLLHLTNMVLAKVTSIPHSVLDLSQCTNNTPCFHCTLLSRNTLHTLMLSEY